MKMKLLVIIMLSSFILVSCSETRTNDPTDSYMYWAGTKPANDLKVLHGRYWQSGHWTKEYVLYLHLKPTDKWWDEFVKQNQLQKDNEDWTKPTDSPDWFQRKRDVEIYKPAGDFNDSRYFRDKANGECYIYEIQL